MANRLFIRLFGVTLVDQSRLIYLLKNLLTVCILDLLLDPFVRRV